MVPIIKRLAVPLGLLLVAGLPGYAQTSRATITGIVTDTTGAVVPGVEIIAENTATGLSYRAITNEVGNYNIGALPIGQYELTFASPGFRQLTRRGIRLTSGQIARIDVALELGAVTESLTVTAETAMIETENAQTSEGVQAEVFSELPLSFGGGRNMAEFADKLVPGVQGSAWNMKIQGTPAGSAGIVIDGMTNLAGFLPGDFGEASISPEAIQELNVQTGNVSAEYGRQSGGTLAFALKSGTNDLHGSAFYYLRNEVLNANNWNNNLQLAADPDFSDPATERFKRPRERRNDYGFSVGGPVFIPKIYNGKNRTFFFFTWEKFERNESGPTNLERTAPQPEMFDGDLSRLLTNNQVGTDALGRPVFEGQIYDPATLRQVNGQFVADPFIGNIIPSSRISQVARNFQSIFSQYYPPVTNTLTNNLYWTRYYQQNVKQLTIKMDHSLSDSQKISGYYYKHNFPRHFQDQGGLWSLQDPDYGGPLAKAMRQERRGYNWNVAHDWIIGPTLLNHGSFGINDNKNFYGSRQAGQGYAQEWGVTGVGNGLPPDQWSAPEFNLGTSPVATFESWGRRDFRDFDYKGYILNDTLSWQKGSHTLKFGFEWNRLTGQDFRNDSSGGIFNFEADTTGIPGQPYTSQTGNSFASFLLGQVDNATTGPPFNTSSYRDYAAAFVQDNWKVTPALTLNLGLRWSGNSPIYERENHMANFNPMLPDPGANGLLGAVEYMNSDYRSSTTGHWTDFGPTAGLAYRFLDKVVFRAGYGITYTPETLGWSMVPNNFVAGYAPDNSVLADSQGLYVPVFNIDNGYPGVETPGNLDPSWAQNRGGTIVSPDYTKAGYIQSVNAGFQVQVTSDLMVEMDWRGSKGTRLHAGANRRPNQIREEELSRGAVLGQVIDSPEAAAAAGLPYPYPGWSGPGWSTLVPFPQLTTRGLTAWGDPVGFSTYHSGNLIVTKRMSHGIYAYGAYTFSKTIANVNDVMGSGNTTGLQDVYNSTVYKSITGDDRTHRIKAAAMWELPMGRGRPLLGNAGGVVNALIGGWTISSILNYTSGAPLGVPDSLTKPVGWNGPAVYANFTAPDGGFTSQFDPDTFDPWNRDSPGNQMFDPSVFSSALPQQLGNSPVRFPTMRQPWTFSEDFSIIKRFALYERLRLELRLELLNAFNRHYFSGPETNMNNSYFGNIWRASGNRTGQAGLRVEW